MRDLPPEVLGVWRAQLARFTAPMDADDFALVAAARTHRLALIKALHDGGARLVVGSDTPNAFVVPGHSVHLELANFVAAGLSPGQALYAATAEPARMLGAPGRSGTIEPGRAADLLLLSADPLADVGAARKQVGVLLAGRWIAQSELAALRGDLAGRQTRR
jgi:imidazolonepropionase-like amidohydrolase